MLVFVVSFSKAHTQGVLAGLVSHNQTVTFPSLRSAQSWVAEARNNKSLSDFNIMQRGL